MVLGVGAGCAIVSINSSVFNSEQLAADTITSATHAFNAYYTEQTNGAAASKIDQLNATRATFYGYVEEAGKGLAVVENLRENYAANSSSTNQDSLLLALSGLQMQTSNVTSFVTLFIGTNAP